MEQRMTKLVSRNGSVPIKIAHGHFATNHSHINYYIDITTLKHRHTDAHNAARELAHHYQSNTVVDTIVCLDGTEVLGAFLARELSHSGIMSLNAHNSIYVITPENNSNSQLVFRDNIKPMLQNKHVLLLMASITTGKTIAKSMECIAYYGGIVSGISAIYSTKKETGGIAIRSIFGEDDLPAYESYDVKNCPQCKAGKPLDALVNSFGYTQLF